MKEEERDEIAIWSLTLFVVLTAIVLVSFIVYETPTVLAYFLTMLLFFESIAIVMKISRDIHE